LVAAYFVDLDLILIATTGLLVPQRIQIITVSHGTGVVPAGRKLNIFSLAGPSIFANLLQHVW
jgi:hypothetical protein